MTDDLHMTGGLTEVSVSVPETNSDVRSDILYEVCVGSVRTNKDKKSFNYIIIHTSVSSTIFILH
jgi:hypothetical protein